LLGRRAASVAISYVQPLHFAAYLYMHVTDGRDPRPKLGLLSAPEAKPTADTAPRRVIAAPAVAGRRFALSIRERRAILAVADFAVAVVATYVAYRVLHRPNARPLQWYDPPSMGAIWVLSLVITDGYASQIPSSRIESGVAVIKALPITALLAVLLFFIQPYVMTRPVIVGSVLIGAIVLVVVRTTAARGLLHESLATQVIIASDTELSPDVTSALHAARFEYRVVGSVVGSASNRDGDGLVEQVRDALTRYSAQEVIVSNNELRLVPGLVEECLTRGVRLVSAGNLVEAYLGRVPIATIDAQWYVELPESDVWRRPYAAARRIFDVILSLVVSLPFAVLLPFLALLIKVDSQGPVFLVQRRVGARGREFNLLKLRTMAADAEEHGARFAVTGDPRVTRIGRFLRATRLDEFPQLVNITRGEMSFIGPRPERPEFESDLEATIPHFRSRLLVKPGLTGWAQIKSGYASTIPDMTRKLEYDLYYIKNRSLRMDLQILAGTVVTLASRRGR
jgi:exopolysaccharide biosynthesis polyprenyl glycosylphosphotransferase